MLRLVGVLVVVGLLVTASPLFAQDQAEVYVRVGLFAPGLDQATVTIDDQLLDGRPELQFGAMSDWFLVPSGVHEVAILPSTDLVGAEGLRTDVTLEAGRWVTLAVIGGAAGAPLQIQPIMQKTDPLAPGETRITLFNAVPGSLPIDFQLSDGTLLISAVNYPNALLASDGTYTIDIVAGPRAIQITPFDDRARVLVDLPNVNFAAGVYHFLVVGGLQESPLPFLLVTDPETMTVQDMHASDASPEIGVGTASVRAIHLALGLGAVDLALGSETTRVAGLEFGKVSPWIDLPAGVYDTMALLAGGAALEPPVQVDDLPVTAGSQVTLVVHGDAARGGGAILPVVTPAGPIAPGETRLILVNAALQSGPVDLRLEDGTLLLGGVMYPDGEHGAVALDIAAGVRTLIVTPAGSPATPLLTLPGLALAENRVTLIALTGVDSHFIPVLAFDEP